MGSDRKSISSMANGSQVLWRTRRLPEWPELEKNYSVVWPLHVYLFGTLFLIVSCSAMITVIGLDTHMTLRRHLIALNVFIFVTAVARCIDLFVDPYGSTQVLAPSVQSLLFDLPFPCLLTAFTLLHVSFNQITQLGISSSRIISAVSIGVVLSIHVSLTAATNLLGSSQLKPKLLWMINQTLFTIWALYSCLGFFWSCIHLLKKVSLHPIVLVTAMHSDSNIAQMQEVALTNLMASTERKPSSTSTSHSQGSSSLTVSILKGFRPKIRITDENDQSYSYHSETPSMQTNSHYEASSEMPSSRKPSAISRSSSTDHGTRNYRPKGGDAIDRLETLREEDGRVSPLRIPAGCRLATDLARPKGRARIEVLMRSVTLISLTGATVCLLQLYAVYGSVLSEDEHIDNAKWLIHQSIQRFAEFLMAALIVNVTSQSFSQNLSVRSKSPSLRNSQTNQA